MDKAQLKAYLRYVYNQYTSHKAKYPRNNMLTNKQMEISKVIRNEIITITK